MGRPKLKESEYQHLIGQKFGRLTVIERSAPRAQNRRELYFRCICECGNETVTGSRMLRRGLSKSCGCLNAEMTITRARKPQGMAGFNRILRTYKKGAEHRGLQFHLSDEEFKTITSSNCHYCNTPPSNRSDSSGTHGYTEEGLRHSLYIYNGIDRLDNNDGYTIDNCVPCCTICNFAKNTLSLKDFENWLLNVHKHYISVRLL